MRKSFVLLPLLIHLSLAAQDSVSFTVKAKPEHSKRRWLVSSATATGFAGSFVLLNKAWYKDYPRSSFHTFNDAGEWKQVDKIGHAWTAYALARAGSSAWRWAGVNRKQAASLGAGSSLLYLLSIEYLDGRSSQWGWSWADVGADLFGTGLFTLQEWNGWDQKLVLKFSSFPKKYADPALEERADDLFGSSWPERLLKDYNRQTYWLSANVRSLLPGTKLPPWLNVAIGYGAEGLFGGYRNYATDKDGNVIFDRPDIPRYRQWYLSPDIDFTRIPTRSALLRTLFHVANTIKIPAPALELSGGRLKLKGMVY